MLELVRVRGFTPDELTRDLREATTNKATRRELRTRYHPGTLRRLGGDAVFAASYVGNLIVQDRGDELETTGRVTYAVTDPDRQSGAPEVVGLATAMNGVRPQLHRLPLPASLARRVPGRDAILGNVNVTGWTIPAHAASLGRVYAKLLADVPAAYSAWTIEPTASDPAIHETIREVGMAPVGDPERYYVGETGMMPAPFSQAYVRP